MRLYKSKHISGVGDFIASVSGTTTDYDITLDDGTVIEGYDETAGAWEATAAPAAGDFLIIGSDGGSRALAVANCEVIPAAIAALVFNPADQS